MDLGLGFGFSIRFQSFWFLVYVLGFGNQGLVLSVEGEG